MRNEIQIDVKLAAHRAGLPGHASGEQNVSKGNFIRIVPLDPAYKAGLAGHVPVIPRHKWRSFLTGQNHESENGLSQKRIEEET